MQHPTKYTPRCGSNQFSECDDRMPYPGYWVSETGDPDALVEYLHEVDVCAEEEFWWDEEERHDL